MSEDTRVLLEDQDDGGQGSVQSNRARRKSRQDNMQQQQLFTFYGLSKLLFRLCLVGLRRFWKLSSAALLSIVLLYWLFGGVLSFVLVVFATTGLLYHSTDRLLYHPDQPSNSRIYVPSPTIVGLQFESIYIKSKDRTRLHLFLLKQSDSAQRPTLLFLHGNAGNIGHRLLNAKGLFSELNVNLCLLEYRGYGLSDGSPSEEGLYLDAQSALEYLGTRSDLDTKNIVIFGRSLGGGVALELASRSENRDRMSCVLVENTFTSIPNIAKELFDFKIVRALPKWCYKNKFASIDKVCKISTPILFLSGEADALIPPQMMLDLYTNCGSVNKRLAKFPGGTHNETWMCPQYYETIKYFFNSLVISSPGPELSGDAIVEIFSSQP